MNPSRDQRACGPSHRTWHQFLADYFIPPQTDGEETYKKIRNVKLQNDGYQQAAWEEDAENAYNKDLRNAVKEDFNDLGAIRCCCDDRDGHIVVLIAADNLAKHADAERMFRYIIVKLDEVVDAPYSILYVNGPEANTRAVQMSNMLALRWFYERFPVKYKLRLKKFFVIQPTNSLWSAMAVFCPFFSHGFWSKVNFVRRKATLWEQIEPVCCSTITFDSKIVQGCSCAKLCTKVLWMCTLHPAGFQGASVMVDARSLHNLLQGKLMHLLKEFSFAEDAEVS